MLRSISLLPSGAALLLSGLATLPIGGHAQCILQEEFNGSVIPNGWDIGPDVELIDADGNGTGAFTPAWRMGDAMEANAGGWFQVPDRPSGTRFIMANDDASPCDCDMAAVFLTTPVVNLLGSTNTAVDLRYFFDGAFGADSAWVEASTNGVDWDLLGTLPTHALRWQRISLSMNAYDGQQTVRVRIGWSDRGSWATGIALDQLCIRSREAYDLSLTEAFLSDPRPSPFNPAVRSLPYSELPLSQALPMVLAAEVRNSGHLPLFNASLSVSIVQNGIPAGPFIGAPIPFLAPGAHDTVVVNTGWIPVNPGVVDVAYTVYSGGSEQGPGDETASQSFRVTASGFDDGDDAMAHRTGWAENVVDNGGGGYRTGVRFELQAGGHIHGITTRLEAGSEAGSWIKGLLMDTELNIVAATEVKEVSQADIQTGLSGGWTFLGFDPPVEVTTDRDLMALVEQLPDSGRATLATVGWGPTGTALFQDLSTNLWTYPDRIPLVRIHLSPVAAGLGAHATGTPFLTIQPNPASDRAELLVNGAMDWRMLDATGREVRNSGALASGMDRHVLDLSGLPTGTYLVVTTTRQGTGWSRLVVMR